MAVNARTYVLPPTVTPSPYGLLSAVDLRPDAEKQWRLGATWQDTCPTGGTTLETCYPSAPAVTGTTFTKTANATRTNWGATPFTIYAEVDCSAPAFWDDKEGYVRAAFERVEQWQLERVFWTGTVAGVANAALPHLAATAAVIEQGLGYTTTLQLAATSVTGVALAAPVALGLVEDALANCLLGVQGVVHVPNDIAPVLAAENLLVQDGPRLRTWNGNRVVLGNGYPRTGPDGSDPGMGYGWIYATGPVFAYRGDVHVLMENNSSLVRTDNTVKAIAERTYLLGYDCCLIAALVSPRELVATSATT